MGQRVHVWFAIVSASVISLLLAACAPAEIREVRTRANQAPASHSPTPPPISSPSTYNGPILEPTWVPPGFEKLREGPTVFPPAGTGYEVVYVSRAQGHERSPRRAPMLIIESVPSPGDDFLEIPKYETEGDSRIQYSRRQSKGRSFLVREAGQDTNTSARWVDEGVGVVVTGVHVRSSVVLQVAERVRR